MGLADMARYKDLTNKTFGRLTAKKIVGKDKHGSNIWLCECLCGNSNKVTTHDLIRGNTKSCGCLVKEKLHSGIARKHGESSSRLYRIWTNIKQRCTNPNKDDYVYYGGKNICVCDAWLNDFNTFQSWSISNGYSDDLTIDRVDSMGNYCPENCRWISIENNVARQAKDGRETPSSKYKGVCRNCTKWQAHYNGIHIGTYDTEYEAFRAREEVLVLGLL